MSGFFAFVICGLDAAAGRPHRRIRVSGDGLAGLGPVGDELLETLVGQRMLDQRLEHGRRGGDNVGADQRGFLDVIDAAHRGGQDLGAKS